MLDNSKKLYNILTMRLRQNIIALLLVFLAPLRADAHSFGSENVAVVANAKARHSIELARYYMERRNIPAEHLVVVRTTWEESCSREEYEQHIQKPVRQALEKLGRQGRSIRALALISGVPLTIASSRSAEDTAGRPLLSRLREREQPERHPNEAEQLGDKDTPAGIEENGAAVDSELSLVLLDTYPLEGWRPNPWFLGFQGQPNLPPKDRVLLTGRLDGPDPSVVKRIIDDSLAAEQRGLSGQLCLDARWPRPEMKPMRGYALYDAAIHLSADIVRKIRRIPVVLDDQPELLGPGRCDNTALYCGWYSLARYEDVFTWQQGAVGYHIASAECTTLKKEGSTVWCKRMLERGAAAVIGPVREPFVEGFPLPDLFFAHLVAGRFSLAESYFLSLPYLSWQMVLVGDPLYRPFLNAR